MKIAIIGEGKGGELIAKHLTDEAEYRSYFEFYDDFKGKPISEIPDDFLLFVSSSNMKFRRDVFARFDRERFININRSDYPMAIMGVNNLIFPNVHFDYYSEIGDNNVISNATIINHHCKVGSGNLFGTGCLLNGSVTIGNNNTIGSGVIFEPKVKIGDNTLICSGSVIVGDVPSGSRVIAERNMQYNSVYQGIRVIK